MAQLLIKGTKVAEVVGDTTSLIANTLYHSSGTQIITDDGGTIGLTNVNLQNINFDNVANNSISGDKIYGGTISGSFLDGIKLNSSGNSITKSDGTTSVLSESGGVVTLIADTAVIEGSSSGDLVRITQTGSGNALVVEDETNPDSTPFVVASNGRVGINKSVPTADLDVVGNADFDSRIKVHDFYINAEYVSSGDANDYKLNGFYRMDTAVSNLPTAYIYAVVVFGNGGNVVTQIATRLATTATYVRSFNTSWTSWASL